MSRMARMTLLCAIAPAVAPALADPLTTPQRFDAECVVSYSGETRTLPCHFDGYNNGSREYEFQMSILLYGAVGASRPQYAELLRVEITTRGTMTFTFALWGSVELIPHADSVRAFWLHARERWGAQTFEVSRVHTAVSTYLGYTTLTTDSRRDTTVESWNKDFTLDSLPLYDGYKDRPVE